MKVTFTTQKNGVRGKKIGNETYGYPLMCPKFSLIWRVLHPRANNTPPSTPPDRVMMLTGLWKKTPTTISKTPKTATKFWSTNLGFEAKVVSTWNLCTAGAMELLCAGIESGIMNLIGHWHSNETIRYLHVQTEPVMRIFSSLMIMHGNSYFMTQKESPCI